MFNLLMIGPVLISLYIMYDVMSAIVHMMMDGYASLRELRNEPETLHRTGTGGDSSGDSSARPPPRRRHRNTEQYSSDE
jgi:hypothetical protein